MVRFGHGGPPPPPAPPRSWTRRRDEDVPWGFFMSVIGLVGFVAGGGIGFAIGHAVGMMP